MKQAAVITKMKSRPDARSPTAKAYRYGYRTARWKALRNAQLKAEPNCRMCKEDGHIEPATIVDHKIPHRGDDHLFWHGALVSLCKAHHDGAKQREEHKGFSTAVGADGWPTSPDHPSNR